ncbi:DEAD/DEAH box helicase [Cognatilysobacter segetis]|uniref:DEAD/DEAH box helicase n=1 Tax=Cognatilysobacter segetis TaxID=2492394 RepID=UPI00105D87B8|nr:DEAD/DEAH box helicase family protein [Lysobacter segetis]
MITPKIYQQRALGSLENFLEATTRKSVETAFAENVDKGLRTEYSPIPSLLNVPYVCLRIPTGGGKTIMGASIIQIAARTVMGKPYPLTLWLVPTTAIKTQTLDALKDRKHPYRQELDEAFKGQVAVFDIADFSAIRPADLGTRACIVVATVQSLRVSDTEGRKVYAHHENLEAHFAGSVSDLPYLTKGENGKALASFENLLRLHSPLIITDEAHNATTELSYEVYERLAPKAIIELTATPDGAASNILVSVAAFELKNENMIKFPLVLKEHSGEWQKAVSAAVARRNELAKIATVEPDYIRPIVLIQAENKRGEANVEAVEAFLLSPAVGLKEEAVRRATGTDRGLEGEDLFAKDCKVEVIVTVQALKEGWDCSFAYIFCSTAQVKSDKDIQQLLGRVLRMPYAMPRKQEAMSKAYAHVVTDTFGRAAGELTQSLINIGFNPLEAAAAVRKERPLPLTGGETAPPPELPKTVIDVAKAPDFSDIPERDKDRVRFTPAPSGKGGTLELLDELDTSTIQAIAEAVPEGEKRDAVQHKVALHQMATQAVKAPSERGEVFTVPRLYLRDHEQLELLEQGQRLPSFTWDLLSTPPDMSSLSIADDAMTFEVYLEGDKVQFHAVKDDAATYLPGFAQDRTLTDLIGWLDQEIRDKALKQPVIREWIRRCITTLHEERGFSEAQLLRAQFVLRRKLREQLQLEKEKAYKAGFNQLLIDGDITVPPEEGCNYTFAPDMTKYPALSYYDGPYRFKKHYYPRPGDLRWKTPGGADGEEYQCAQQIDLLDDVQFWVRNLVHPTQFWMPTSKQRTYPDFVLRLSDGRLFVVEYKGGDRFSADQEKEKRMVGELWEKRSGGRGLYLMAQKRDDKGRDVRQQLLDKLNDR